MTAMVTLLRNDVRLQYRYGIYAAYGVVVVLYAAMLQVSTGYLPRWVVGVLIFSDPAALGFFFLGALMMLEKAEGVRIALAAAPVTSWDYYIGKVVTLTAVALIACAALLPLHASTNPALLLLTVALTSIQYIGIGIPTAFYFRTVNGYLIGSAAFLTPVIAPGFLALLDPMPIWLSIIPAVSQLRLMLVATGAASADAGEIAIRLFVCALAAGGGSWLALRALRKELGK